ncbi:hypothetical protein B0H10DRAFT_2234545 [Mycena sp. CBHHK59/15]|nr:hypothetical protein B0H10DRAFT_2234545 [Mycena sp. CBHHK59/15]
MAPNPSEATLFDNPDPYGHTALEEDKDNSDTQEGTVIVRSFDARRLAIDTQTVPARDVFHNVQAAIRPLIAGIQTREQVSELIQNLEDLHQRNADEARRERIMDPPAISKKADLLLLLKVPLRYAAYLQREEIVAAQVGAEKNAKAKAKMTAMANEQCDVIESNDFWTGLETLVDDIEPICYATNINQADRTRADQVLLSFAGVVSKGMCARIEKRWAALDQPFFTFCLILNPYEVLERFGDKAGLNIFVLSAELMTLYRRVQFSAIYFSDSGGGTGDFAPWEANKETFGRDNGNDPMKVWEQLKACPDVVELANFALLLLGLVVNQASNECSFSDLKIKKTRLRNRLGIPKLEKMSKLGSSIRTEHLQEGLIDERKPRNVHDANKAASLISVPRYADVLETADGDGEEETQPKLVKSACLGAQTSPSGRQPATNQQIATRVIQTMKSFPLRGLVVLPKIFPRSLDLLFGGVVLMMELLAAEESDEEPDDGALPGSEDEYTP